MQDYCLNRRREAKGGYMRETKGILWEGLTATQGPVNIQVDECLSLTAGNIQIAVPLEDVLKAISERFKEEP
jgi:hypothetical protein